MVKIDWSAFVIKPSRIISSLCYSIFRIEPYSICTYSCLYCYARWYRGKRNTTPKQLYLKIWEKTIKELTLNTLPKPYFRIATLTEPLQEKLEEKHKITLEFLETALRYDIPVILNTKSTLTIKEPWFTLLTKMNEKKRILIQYSLFTLNDLTAKKLEPYAPPPSERLRAIETLLDHDIPVVVRLQPLVPYLEDEILDTAKELSSTKIKGFIIESLRDTISNISKIANILGIDKEAFMNKFEKYMSTKGELYTPSHKWRIQLYRSLDVIARKSRKILSNCKEFLEPNKPIDCCLFWTTGSRYAVRPTLRELLGLTKPVSNARLVYPSEFNKYPYIIKRGLKLHHNKLMKVFVNKEYYNIPSL